MTAPTLSAAILAVKGATHRWLRPAIDGFVGAVVLFLYGLVFVLAALMVALWLVGVVLVVLLWQQGSEGWAAALGFVLLCIIGETVADLRKSWRHRIDRLTAAGGGCS